MKIMRRIQWLCGIYLMVFMVMCTISVTAQAETDVTNKIQLVKGTLSYDRLNKQSYLNVSVKNISNEVLIPPIRVFVEGISNANVWLSNADGATDEGKAFFEYKTGNGLLLPGETTLPSRWTFQNNLAAKFSYQTHVSGNIPDAVTSIGPEGGMMTVNNPSSLLNGLTVTVPPNALSGTEYITVRTITENLPEEFKYAAAAMDFSSNSNVFNDYIQISLPYLDANNDGFVDGTDIPENDIMIVTFDSVAGKWNEVPIKTLDTANNIITFEVNHFSLYAAVKRRSFEDSQAPKLVSFNYSKTTVDVSDGSKQIDFTLKATDNLSGIKNVYVYAYSESSQYYAYGWTSLSSGTAWNGVYKGTITIPQYMPAGKWSFSSIYIEDNVGNHYDSYIQGQSYEFNVTNTSSTSTDTEVPKLTSFTYSTNTVNVSNGPQQIDFTIIATDNLSGIKRAYVYAYSPSGQQYEFGWASLTSGSYLNGVYKGTIEIPQYAETGQWSFTYIYIEDNVGNYYYPDMQGQSYVFQVTSTSSDTEAPKLTSFTYTPATVNVKNGPAQIDFTIKATDNQSGISQAYVYAYSESGEYYAYGWASLTSGSNLNGVYKGSITIPQYTPTGKWSFRNVVICDNVGNCGGYQWDGQSHHYEFGVNVSIDRLSNLIILAENTQIGQELLDYIEYFKTNNLFSILPLTGIYGDTSAGWVENQIVQNNTLTCDWASIYIRLDSKVINDIELASTLIHEITHYRDAVVASQNPPYEINIGDTEIRAHANEYVYLMQVINSGYYTIEQYNQLPSVMRSAMEICWKYINGNATREQAINSLAGNGYTQVALDTNLSFVCVAPF